MSSGFEDIVSDQDFPVTERLSKWGAHDHLVFNRLLEDLKAEAAEGTAEEKTPHFRVLQTSSSHEPFEVPFRRLENDRLNAFAYTDSCAGDFVRQFRELPQWKNTVIVFVPDHLGAYPEHIAIVKGDVSGKEGVMVRVHSECLTGDVFGSRRCDCGDQLHAAMKMINDEGTGA